MRAALAASIDRTAISAKITLGRYPVADSDRPRFSWAYDPVRCASRTSTRPPPIARSMRQAGAGAPAASARAAAAGFALTYVQFPETSTGVRVAAFVQRELFERGLDVTVKSISNAQLFLPATDGGVLASGRFDLAYVPWTMGADPDDRFLVACGTGTKNYMRYCDPEVDRLEDAAAADPDRAARRRAYAAVDRRVARDVPIVYLFNPTYPYAYRSELRGFAPNAFVPTWNAYAWSLP